MGKDEPKVEDQVRGNQEESREEIPREVRNRAGEWSGTVRKGKGFKQEADSVQVLDAVMSWGWVETGHFKDRKGQGCPATFFLRNGTGWGAPGPQTKEKSPRTGLEASENACQQMNVQRGSF